MYSASEFNKGKELAQSGRYEEAIKFFDKAITEKPDYKEAYNEKGKALVILGRVKDAVKCFVLATMIDPDYVEAWTNMEGAHLIEGKYDLAIRCVDQILRITPNNEDAYLRKGRILSGIGKKEEAYKCFNRAIQLNPECKNMLTSDEKKVLTMFGERLPREVIHVTKKVCMLGDPAVGKTSLIRRYVYDTFDDAYLTTIGAKVTKKTLKIGRTEPPIDIMLTMLIWDIAGQEKFSSVHELYYKGTDGMFLVSDVTKKETIDNMSKWRDIIFRITDKTPAVCMLNKTDLAPGDTIEGDDRIKRVSSIMDLPALYTSAKTGTGTEKAFTLLGTEITRGLI
jgi:small GTP-binding protein